MNYRKYFKEKYLVSADKRNRKDMLDFLNQHEQRWFNWDYGFCQDVKLHFIHHNSGFQHLIEKAYFAISENVAFFDDVLEGLVASFEVDNPGFSIQQLGRSAGYFVLSYNGKPYGIRQDDFETMTTQELKECSAIVQNFDKFVVDIMTEFFEYLENRDLVTEIQIFEKEVTYLKEKDEKPKIENYVNAMFTSEGK